MIGEGLAWAARWSWRFLLVAAGLVVLGYIINQLWTVMFPVFLALIIATVLGPPAAWMRKRGLPPALAALIVMVGALGILAGVVAVIAPSVAGQAPEIARSAIAGIEQIQEWLQGPPFNLGASDISAYIDAAIDQLQASASAIAGGVVTGLTAIASGLITTVLALVVAFLFIKDGHRFLPWLRARTGPTAGAHLVEVGQRAWGRLGGFIRSQALIGLVDATFIGIGLALFGVQLALPLAVLTFFAAFIPIVGALFAGAVSVLIALVTQGPAVALGVLVLIVAVQQIEGNLLQPFVQGRGLGLHAAVVILAVTAGSSLAGIAGAFLAVPIAAVVAEVLRYLDTQIAERAGEVSPEDEEAASGDGERQGPAVVAAVIGEDAAAKIGMSSGSGTDGDGSDGNGDGSGDGSGSRDGDGSRDRADGSEGDGDPATSDGADASRRASAGRSSE